MFVRAVLLGVLLGTGSVAAAQTPRDLVGRAVAAMGGAERLRGINSLTTEFYTATFAVGQEETPASRPRAQIAIGRNNTDYRNSRRVGTIELRTVAGQVNQLRRVTAGGIGMLETNGRQAPVGLGATTGELAALRRAPERLLLAAWDNPSSLVLLPRKGWRGQQLPGVRYAQGPDTLDLYFDPVTALLAVTEQVADDAVLGDRHTAGWFSRWQETGGVKFPRQYDVEWNGRHQTHSVITAVTVNPDLPDSLFVIPDSIAARAPRPPATPTPPTVVVQLVELAPGVWRAEGGSHHSLVVEQPTRLVVIEAPQNATRSKAVLDTLRRRFPGKPVRLAVNTHHHWDHSGGVRGYLAAGIGLVTHAGNADFIGEIARAPKAVAPDGLGARPRSPLQLARDSLVIGTGDSRVVLYELPTVHVQGMLAAYVPAARILFNSDVLTPGPTLAPAGSAEIVALVRARGITVERVVGGHGGIANWQDVVAAAASP
ncbi:MAG TPA: MBL fold metallo-hydrolase [Gemmatimonadales bacterium]